MCDTKTEVPETYDQNLINTIYYAQKVNFAIGSMHRQVKEKWLNLPRWNKELRADCGVVKRVCGLVSVIADVAGHPKQPKKACVRFRVFGYSGDNQPRQYFVHFDDLDGDYRQQQQAMLNFVVGIIMSKNVNDYKAIPKWQGWETRTDANARPDVELRIREDGVPFISDLSGFDLE